VRTTWILQTNVEPTSRSPALLRRACGALGLPLLEVAVAPGAPELPPLPDLDGPVVFHGRTTLILRALAHPRWRRGVFFDPERFQHRAYAQAWGTDLLNAGAEVLTWEALLARPWPGGEARFVKPNDDLKRFTGGVLRHADCAALHARLVEVGWAPPGSEVVVGPAREVDAEWRLFVVGGAIVTGSMYRPSADAFVPPEVETFARGVVARWTPADAFALDVARVDGGFKVVECNCLNGSGFYLADVERLVRAVSRWQEGRE
jgi:hypothetical protein